MRPSPSGSDATGRAELMLQLHAVARLATQALHAHLYRAAVAELQDQPELIVLQGCCALKLAIQRLAPRALDQLVCMHAHNGGVSQPLSQLGLGGRSILLSLHLVHIMDDLHAAHMIKKRKAEALQMHALLSCNAGAEHTVLGPAMLLMHIILVKAVKADIWNILYLIALLPSMTRR